jgi:hypothetical protein
MSREGQGAVFGRCMAVGSAFGGPKEGSTVVETDNSFRNTNSEE